MNTLKRIAHTIKKYWFINLKYLKFILNLLIPMAISAGITSLALELVPTVITNVIAAWGLPLSLSFIPFMHLAVFGFLIFILVLIVLHTLKREYKINKYAL